MFTQGVSDSVGMLTFPDITNMDLSHNGAVYYRLILLACHRVLENSIVIFSVNMCSQFNYSSNNFTKEIKIINKRYRS